MLNKSFTVVFRLISAISYKFNSGWLSYPTSIFEMLINTCYYLQISFQSIKLFTILSVINKSLIIYFLDNNLIYVYLKETNIRDDITWIHIKITHYMIPHHLVPPSHLVNLVYEYHWVLARRLLQALDYLSGHGPHIGAPVALSNRVY